MFKILNTETHCRDLMSYFHLLNRYLPSLLESWKPLYQRAEDPLEAFLLGIYAVETVPGCAVCVILPL